MDEQRLQTKDPSASHDNAAQGSGSDTRPSADEVKAPFQPHQEDDSPLGDTDQHSDA
jgi:hypothetical protein